jgi:hypothetical protein
LLPECLVGDTYGHISRRRRLLDWLDRFVADGEEKRDRDDDD